MSERRSGSSCRRIARAALLAACAALAALPSARSEPLRGLFDPALSRRDAALDARAGAECPNPPPPVIDLADVVFYTDPANSVVSRALFQQRMELTRALRDFSAAVTDRADLYLLAATPSETDARCVGRWLRAWAEAGALLGQVATWARYDTLWFGQIPLAVAFLKVWHSPSLDLETRSIVRRWLGDVARAAMAEQAKPAFRDRLTNIRAWTAAGAAVGGLAGDDRELFDYAVAQAGAILGTVTAEGALPAELARGRRAFLYHNWALEPLTLIALAAGRNGAALTGDGDAALGRVAAFVLRSAREPEFIARLAGAEQDNLREGWPDRHALAWVERLLAVRPVEAAEAFLAPRRPIGSAVTGGDWSRALGR